MKFTSTPPTTPGFYAWRINPIGDLRIAHVFGKENLFCERMGYQDDKIPIADLGGYWCRLVPAEELKKAYAEGWAIPDYIDPEVAWNSSRAKQISEGKE